MRELLQDLKEENLRNRPLLPHVQIIYNETPPSLIKKEPTTYSNEKPSDFVQTFLAEFELFERSS